MNTTELSIVMVLSELVIPFDQHYTECEESGKKPKHFFQYFFLKVFKVKFYFSIVPVTDINNSS